MLGALASIAPGVVVTPMQRNWRMRVFARAEVAGSFESSDSPGVVRILAERGSELDPLLRAGGLEITLTAGLGVWFPTSSRP